NGRVPTAAGIASPSIKISTRLAQVAERHGAAAVQYLVAGRAYGGTLTIDQHRRQIDAIAAAVDIPIGLYLNSAAGAALTLDATVSLASHERVAFVKESSRDQTRIGYLIDQIDKAGLAQYLTTMQTTLSAIQLGASGITLPPPAD